jgi:uncharacterized protein (TIGR03086 family)
MDILQNLDSAAQAMAAVARGVTPDQLQRPTPCTEWNVQQLMNHAIGSFENFEGRAAGREVDWSNRPSLTDHGELVERLSRSAAGVAAAWARPGALDQKTQAPFGEVTGAFMANITLTELLMHGWDLAKATGQQLPIDQAIPEEILGGMRQNMPEQARQSAFGPEVPASEGAPAIDRLAAFLGRKP